MKSFSPLVMQRGRTTSLIGIVPVSLKTYCGMPARQQVVVVWQ
jgi:hypothetical protein